MPDDNFQLKSLLRTTPAEPAQADEESGLPARDDRQYVPHSRPANKPLYSLHFVGPTGTVTSFQYVHLDSNSTYGAECITLKFLGMEPMKVIIHGRNLWRLYDYLHQHRIAWVMQSSRDFAQDGQTIVIDVKFTAVKEAE